MNKNLLYKKVLNTLILPIGDKLIGSNYQKILNTWKVYDSMSYYDLEKTQKKALLDILNHSRESVPFYKNKIPNNLTEENIFNQIQKLPILSKDLLNDKRDELVSEKFDKNSLIKNYSSGSTGKQSYSYSLKKEKFRLQAIQRHWFEWTGFKDGDPVIQFGISPDRGVLKKTKDFFFNVYYYSAFSLSYSDFEEIFKKLKDKNIRFLIGYPSAINEFSKWMIQEKLNHKIDAIISLGDKLFNNYEVNFNKTFLSPKILDTYGCAEGFLIAARFDIDHYYISSPHVYVEVVNDDGEKVKDGEIGHLLVTGLTNYAQPFFRYKLGDMAVKLPFEKYPSKRQFKYPLLEYIVGRENEIIETPNNLKLVVHSFTGVFEYFPEIEQYKIVQEKRDLLVIKYITKSDFEKNLLRKIKKELKKITENSMCIEFQKVNSIEKYNSGKPQIIEVKDFN